MTVWEFSLACAETERYNRELERKMKNG